MCTALVHVYKDFGVFSISESHLDHEGDGTFNRGISDISSPW